MSIYYEDESVTLHHGEALRVARTLDTGSVNAIVTSPPYYGLRDYDVPDQIGLEPTPAEYVTNLTAVFTELHRVLADDGTLWLNLGDSYNNTTANQNGSLDSSTMTGAAWDKVGRRRRGLPVRDMPAKNLLGIPWRVAFALQDAGWILRNAIVWTKPNAMPESVRDRMSGRYEHVFLFSKNQRYWFDLAPLKEPLKTTRATGHMFGAGNKAQRRTGSTYDSLPEGGRNPGDVWEIATQPFPGAHFATMPLELARRCIVSGCKPDGVVLDPFSGSGTTGQAATMNGRHFVGIDLNAAYLDLSLRTRLANKTLTFPVHDVMGVTP